MTSRRSEVSGLVDNSAWLAGYAAYGRGEPCPWGDESCRAGWLAARDDEAAK